MEGAAYLDGEDSRTRSGYSPSMRTGLLLLALTAACSQPEWEGGFDEPVARPEHPRPDWRRDSFVNLNTAWDFAYDPQDQGLSEGWQHGAQPFSDTIQLPWAWEAPLSGLVQPHEGEYLPPILDPDDSSYRGVAWYRLQLPGPLPQGDDWWLVFGAVDFEATVWVDGVQVGQHTGGYAPFSVNLSQGAGSRQGAVITVRVVDHTEANPDGLVQPVGKQGGFWYTRTSGIWQTVYLEQRPRLHLRGLTLRPDPELGEVQIIPDFAGVARVEVVASLDGEVVGQASAPAGTPTPLRLVLSQVAPWSHATPTLYDLEVRLISASGTDVVRSYFGLVEVGRDWLPGRSPDDTDDPLQQAQVFTVNGEPTPLRCVLDQSYWPDGILTAPSLDDIEEDIALVQDMGFNCVRVHIKGEEPVKLRLLDEAGLYVVQDVPSLDMLARNTQGFAGREHFESTLTELITRDRNHPSILLWTVFNENWGLISNGRVVGPTLLSDEPELRDWVQDMVELTHELDPTRPVEDNSAGGLVGDFEHVTGDSNSFHFYDEDPARWRELMEAQSEATFPGSTANWVGDEPQSGQPWWNSEFASFSYSAQPEGEAHWCALFGALNEQRRLPRLVGTTLTQLTDVEFELNGLVRYDRTPHDSLCTGDGVGLVDVLGPDFVGFDWLPGEQLQRNRTYAAPLFFSQWEGSESREITVRAWWPEENLEAGEVVVTSQPWEVVPFELLLEELPEDSGETELAIEALVDGVRVAANRIEVEIR